MMTHDNTSMLDIVFLHRPLAESILKATNQHNKPLEKEARATYPSPPHPLAQSRRENRHRRCAAPNLPSFVLLSVMLATLAVTPAPTALVPAPAPALASVPDEGKEERKDDEVGPDRSSIGGKRSLSMSDLRLWVNRGK